MTISDVKQYLEKLYGIKAMDARVEIKRGEYMKHPAKPNALSPPKLIKLILAVSKIPPECSKFKFSALLNLISFI
jgi:hypothetical protein